MTPTCPTEEPGSQEGFTRCGLVVGPDEILGFHHDHGKTLGRWEVAEGQQDLAHSVSGLEDRRVTQRASAPGLEGPRERQKLPSPLRSCCSWGPLHQGTRLVGLRKGPLSCSTAPSLPCTGYGSCLGRKAIGCLSDAATKCSYVPSFQTRENILR